MGDQQQGQGGNALSVAKGLNWANGITRAGQAASAMRGGQTAAQAVSGSGGLFGAAGKAFAPMALATGIMGMGQGISEMWNADDGRDMATGGIRTLGGAAATTAGGIGTLGLLGAGAAAAGGSGLLAGTAVGGGLLTAGGAMAGAAAAAAPVAAVAAPIAAAIGLGFRGESFMQEHFGGGVGDFIDTGSDWGSGAAEWLGAEEGGLLSTGAGYLGAGLGAVAGGVTAVGAGVAGVAEDAWSLVTSW